VFPKSFWQPSLSLKRKLKMKQKITDIKDESTGLFLHEFDLVEIHNWNIFRIKPKQKQPIGIGYIKWDSDYHKWDFVMMVGHEIEDEFNKWRTSPKKIGTVLSVNPLIYTITDKKVFAWMNTRAELKSYLLYHKYKASKEIMEERNKLFGFTENKDNINKIKKEMEQLKNGNHKTQQ